MDGAYTPTGTVSDILYTFNDNSATITLESGYSGLEDLSNADFSMDGAYTPTGTVSDTNTAILYTFNDNSPTIRLESEYSALGGDDLNDSKSDPRFSINYTPQGSITPYDNIHGVTAIEYTMGSQKIVLETLHTTLANTTGFSHTHIPVGAPTIRKSVVHSSDESVTLEDMIIELNHRFSDLHSVSDTQNNFFDLYPDEGTIDYSNLAGFPTLFITLRDPNNNDTILSEITVSSDRDVHPLPAIQDTNVFTSVPLIETLTGDVSEFVVRHGEFVEAKDNYELSSEPSNFEMILSGDKSQVKGHLKTFSFTHDEFTSVYTAGQAPFASTNDYFVVLDNAHPKGTLEISGNTDVLTQIKDSTISFVAVNYNDHTGAQKTISANNIEFKNKNTNDNVNGIGTEPDGTIKDFAISFGTDVSSLTVASTVVEDTATKFEANDDNVPLEGIARSIKLGETDGSTDYIILPINEFGGDVDTKTQSFEYDSNDSTHYVYLHSNTESPLVDNAKIKITPVGLISKFKDIYDENSEVDNISMTSVGKIRYEQDDLEFQNDSNTIKNLYSSKNIFFSGTLDYSNAGIPGKPIGDYEITNRGSGFDGVTSPVISETFKRIADPSIQNAYTNPNPNRSDEGLGAVGFDSTGMFLGEVRELNLIDGGQNYTTDSVVEFKRNSVISQLGNDIIGEGIGDYFGVTVSLSNDGSRIAIGGPFNDGAGSNAGHVRVLEWDYRRGSWIQMGSDIDGLGYEDRQGLNVSLSSDGSRLAIGVYHSYTLNDGLGAARVYEWNSVNLSWEQLGNTINGDHLASYSGWSVALSADGLRVVIGAINYDKEPENDDNYGLVRVYEWNSVGSSWDKMGQDIEGEAAGDRSGYSVSSSADGSIIAIGAIYNDGVDGQTSDAGHVRVYEWNSETWEKRGDDIDGVFSGDRNGRSVSLSSDGTRIAIGEYKNDESSEDAGKVRVFDWNSVESSWKQTGNALYGEASGDLFGIGVSLSSDGNRLAIGGSKNDGNAIDAGHVRLFEFNSLNERWDQIGYDIEGRAANDYSGMGLSLSGDGKSVAIGSYFNDAGHVRVFDINTSDSLIINTGGIIPVIDGKYTVTSNPNDTELKHITSPELSGAIELLHESGNLKLESANSSKWKIVDIASNREIVTSTFNDGIDLGGNYNDSNYNDIFRTWKADGQGYSNPYHDELKNTAIDNIVILEPATFTFKVNSVDNGIITGISINNGGKDFVADAEMQVQDENRAKIPTTVKITDLDNAHIEKVELVDPGSGYSNGDNTVVSIKDAVNNETVLIQTDNDYGNTNESILCILEKLDNILKGN